jgi:hypothetical protein
MDTFIERHAAKIVGALSCLDRVLIRGTLPTLCYREGMMSYLIHHGVRIYDYPKWAHIHHDRIAANAAALAATTTHGKPIFVRKFRERRKEDIVQEQLAAHGDRPGLVCILAAMEACPTYRPQRGPDKNGVSKPYLKGDIGKCLHYYFYFLDEALGLVHVRVPTWAPFGLQFYFNGHSVLERRLKAKGIGHTMIDNAFAAIDDFSVARRMADNLITPERLHRILDRYARLCCPPAKELEPRGYHWSLWQVEYSTDIVFKSQEALAPLYEELTTTAICALRADDVANFLGHKLDPKYKQEVGGDFELKVEGRRIKHRMGPASLKMYDKFGLILRIETTTSDVSFFKHHRRVEHKDGSSEMKMAPMQKTIYNIGQLCPLMAACNRRYLAWLAAIDDPSVPLKDLDKLARRACDGERSSRGFNFFSVDDLDVIQTLADGRWAISGLRNRDLRMLLDKTAHQVSHLLRRMRLHGLIKKAGGTFKYHVTAMGKRVLSAGLRLREALIIPSLRPALRKV